MMTLLNNSANTLEKTHGQCRNAGRSGERHLDNHVIGSLQPEGLSLYVGMTKDTHLSKEEDWLTFVRSDLRQMATTATKVCSSTL